MSSIHIRWGSAAVLILFLCGSAVAQERESVPAGQEGTVTAESSPDPAKKYSDLKKSKDRAIKALADRYDDLIGVQEWIDASGKHKTKAKYVEHDPDLKWVMLSITTGSGDKATVKETTVQLASLHKASQAKVRQIAALQRKLDELSAEANASGAGGVVAAGGEYGRGERRPGDESAAGTESQADPSQWPTSYDSFRANFKFEANPSGAKVMGWGQLQDLKAASEASMTKQKRPAREGEVAEPTDPADVLSRVSEVHWEAPLVKLTKAKAEGGDHEVEFRLTSLPRPMKMRFLLAANESVDAWSKLPASTPVKFVGRFETVKPRVMVLRVSLDGSPPPAADGTVPPGTAPADVTPTTSENPFEDVQ